MSTTVMTPMEDALAPEQIAQVAKGHGQSIASEPVPATSDSDEDMPLSQRALKVQKVSFSVAEAWLKVADVFTRYSGLLFQHPGFRGRFCLTDCTPNICWAQPVAVRVQGPCCPATN